jgi:Trp operon repressor
MTMQTQPTLSVAIRKQFHQVFLDWLASADDDELEMLEALMARSVSIEVRSMLTFIRECLEKQESGRKLPQKLVQGLAEKNWPQGESFLRVVAVDGVLT